MLLMKFTFRESCSDTPAPSQPATLLAMMLLVTLTEYHSVGFVGKRDHFRSVDALEADAAAAAAFRRVAHDQVGVDHQAGTGAVAQARRAIHVGSGAALGSAHGSRPSGAAPMTHDTATVGRDRRVGALVEQDRVVLDVPVRS